MFAIFGALEHFTPFHDPYIQLEADLRQVGLQQLRTQHRVGVGRAAAIAGEQGQHRTFGYTGFLEQRAGLVQVAGRPLDVGVVAQHGRRIGVDGKQGIAFAVYGVQIGLLVKGHVDGFAHAHIAQVLVTGIHGDIAGHQGGQFIDLEVGVFADVLDVIGFGIQRDLAFVGLEFLQAHVAVGGDGEDQVVAGRLAAKVIRVGLEANLGVLVVTHENKWPGADRLVVEVGGFAGLEQLVGVFGGVDGVERHGHVAQKRRFRVVESDFYRQVVNFLDALEQVLETHAFKVGVTDQRQFVPRVIRVQLALKTPDHVIGVQGSGRFEIISGVKLYVGTQVKCVFKPVRADVPALGQGGLHIRGAGGKVDQAVEYGLGRSIGSHGGGELDDVEPFRAGFSADHQVFRAHTDSGAEQCRGQGGA